MKDDHVCVSDAGALLAAVAKASSAHADLSRRREATLLALAETIGADAGWWSWGRGWPDSSTIVPVAQISFGLNDEQRIGLIEMALDTEGDREFRSRILLRLAESPCVTSTKDDLYSTQEWQDDPFLRRMIRRGGWTSCLIGVRYSDIDTWSNLLLLRNEGRNDFGRREAALAHLVLDSVPWMHSTAEESLPPSAFVGLTPRRRTVMLMVLDGNSRKEIASNLGIGEETVGDHIKAIYAHFGVNGASQLAALFLRNR